MNLARNSARTSVLIAAATCVIFTAELTAQFTVVSQNRSVSANAQLSSCIFEGPGEFPVAAATMSTENAGVFSQSVDANMSVTTTPGLACVAPSEEIASSATQDTVIAGAILQGTGIARAGKGGASTESGEAGGLSML